VHGPVDQVLALLDVAWNVWWWWISVWAWLEARKHGRALALEVVGNERRKGRGGLLGDLLVGGLPVLMVHGSLFLALLSWIIATEVA
jgi:hypothetical protein